jgi:hypothetical protein
VGAAAWHPHPMFVHSWLSPVFLILTCIIFCFPWCWSGHLMACNSLCCNRMKSPLDISPWTLSLPTLWSVVF